MKAAFYEGNETITIGSCEPRPPAAHEVRIEVAFCGVCGTDLHIFHGAMDQRVRFPQVLGHEMSGEIAEIGRGVEGFSVGDRVVVRPLDPCGECAACESGCSHICQNLKFLGIDTPGAFQSSWTVPAHTLHRVPDSLSLRLAAMVEPIAVACHDVRMGRVKQGEYVVVIGGGPIGMLVALVARSKGARVVLSEINAFRIGLARQLGLETVDPQETDLASLVEEQTKDAGADVVFEVSGSVAGAKLMTRLPRVRGRIVVVAIHSEPPKVDLFRFFWRELNLCGVRVYEPRDYEEAIELASSASIPFEPLITETRPLEALSETFRQMGEGENLIKVLMDCSR